MTDRNRITWLLTTVIPLAAALGCRDMPRVATQGRTTARQVGQRPAACSAGRTIDSAYVVGAARGALGGDSTLVALSYDPVTAPGPIEEGVLVRMVSRRSRLGGGGLAFVDGESGCALALRRYE
jgi:hypothetical protein